MAKVCSGKDEQCLEEAVHQLTNDKCVALPTETVYGLAASIESPHAVHHVFELKGRPNDNPLIVHVADVEMAKGVGVLSPLALDLAKEFWPGPLTMVLPKNERISNVITAGLPTVAVRCPKHPVFLTVLQSTGPLVAPSANVSGRPSPSRAQHVLDDFAQTNVLIVDGGECQLGLESTIVKVEKDCLTILRPGSIRREELQRIAPVVDHIPTDQSVALAPGMKYRHYAPNATVILVEQLSELDGTNWSDGKHVLLLVPPSQLTELRNRVGWNHVEAVTQFTLYEQLRRADTCGFAAIVCVCSHEVLNDVALMNRLQKAESRT